MGMNGLDTSGVEIGGGEMSEDYQSASVGRGTRALRLVVPWVLFVVVVWAIASIWGDFVHTTKSLTAATQGSGASAVSTSVAGSTVTTVTGLSATVRSEIPLMSQPSTTTAIIATSKQGSTLTIVAKQGTWFRVKDSAGHIGWIVNSNQFITVRPTPAPKPKAKKK